MSSSSSLLSVSFSHVHLYVDHLDDLMVYKTFEGQLNELWKRRRSLFAECRFESGSGTTNNHQQAMIQKSKELWRSIVTTTPTTDNYRDGGKNDNNNNNDIIATTGTLSSSVVGNLSDETKKNDDENGNDDSYFKTQNRDVVRQMLAGFGFRITSARYATPPPPPPPKHGDTTTTTTRMIRSSCSSSSTSRSVLLTSRDPNGIQVLVTAATTIEDDSKKEQPQPPQEEEEERKRTTKEGRDSIPQDPYYHFDAARVRLFYQVHNQRQGIAVLAFWVNDVALVKERYQLLHPQLISHYQEYNDDNDNNKNNVVVGGGVVSMLEVFAFYQAHNSNNHQGSDTKTRTADQGTVLRFIQQKMPLLRNDDDDDKSSKPHVLVPLPGLEPVEAIFDDDYSYPAYCDHWVSNVINRTEFLDILHDTLDFEIKVDFNAGVVAAGEAQIESSVAGNNAKTTGLLYNTTHDNDDDKDLVVVRDQSQVFLPINNALSNVGHVYLFLQEIGQGVQHVASRVPNLVRFVQQVNEQRQITGEGFTFLPFQGAIMVY